VAFCGGRGDVDLDGPKACRGRGGDAAVAAVGQRQPVVADTSLLQAAAQVVDDLGSGETALELVGCEHRRRLGGITDHRGRSESTALSHRPTNGVATALPMKLTIARHSDMNLSIPKISMMPAAGTVPIVLNVAAIAMNPPPATPAAPFEVSSITATRPSCWPIVRFVPVAWAMNTAARDR
jgi:hypothetical protein